MKTFVLAAMALAASALAAPTRAAQPVVALPQWSSDQVRAARPLDPADALVFEVRRTRKTDAGSQTSSETVTLAPTFTLVATADGARLYDRTLCRVLAWSSDKPRLSSVNCHADPGVRMLEVVEREKSKTRDKAQAYWDEAGQGVQSKPAAPLTKSGAEADTQYRLGGEVVVRIAGDAGAMSPAEAGLLVGYLARSGDLHPQVRRDIKARGRLPGRLEIIVGPAGKDRAALTVEISNPRRASVAYPLPAGLAPAVRAQGILGGSPAEQGLQAALLAIEGRSTLHKPSFAELVEQMRKASAAKQQINVMLLYSNMGNQYLTEMAAMTPATRADMTIWVNEALKDTTAARYWVADGIAGGKGTDKQQAANFLANAKFQGLPFGTYRYVTFANIVRGADDVARWDPAILKAMPQPIAANYWTHIAAYPWSSFAYKDVGDTYLQARDEEAAWLAFDLGRAVDPNWRIGPMGALANYETALRTTVPDFF